MEEALKAGHVLEPDRDMQFCAKVTEVDDASSVNRSDFCIVDLFMCLEYVAGGRLCSRSRKQVIRTENLFMDKVPSCDNQFVFAQLLSCFQLVVDSRSGNVANPSQLKLGC